jgi:ABC-type transporter Mla subunit MlaD
VSLAAQDEALTQRVGAISLALIATAIVFFVFVEGRIEWGRHVRIQVAFHHVGSLREGAAFVVAGRTVGKVETITPRAGDAEEGVIVTVAIESGIAAKLDRAGDVFIASRGALSEKYLELGPAPEATAGEMLHDGDTLVGRDPPSLDRVLQRTWDNLTTLGTFTDEIRPELDALRAQIDELRGHFATTGDSAVPNAAQIGPLIDDASTITAQIRQLRERGLGGLAGAAELAAVIDRARGVLAASRGSLDKLAASATELRAAISSARGRIGTKGDQAIAAVELAIDRVRADIAKVDPLLAQIEAFSAQLARGEGSLMKLMRDPEFPEDAKELGKVIKRHPWKIIDRPSR